MNWRGQVFFGIRVTEKKIQSSEGKNTSSEFKASLRGFSCYRGHVSRWLQNTFLPPSCICLGCGRGPLQFSESVILERVSPWGTFKFSNSLCACFTWGSLRRGTVEVKPLGPLCCHRKQKRWSFGERCHCPHGCSRQRQLPVCAWRIRLFKVTEEHGPPFIPHQPRSTGTWKGPLL